MILKGTRILIHQTEPEQQTAGGIFIPETLQKPRNIGKVIAVGDTADQSLLGKDVVFHIQASQKFEHDDIKGVIVFETDLIATL